MLLNEDMLSQDEIDALLKGTDDAEEVMELTPLLEDYVSVMEQDALGEIGNISFGSSTTALSTLLDHKVEITTPTVTLIERERIKEEFPLPYVAVEVRYTSGFSGTNILVIKQSDAAIIADIMLGGDGLNPSATLGDIQLSAIQEAMNQMMGSAATSMSTVFNKKVDISPPVISLMDLNAGEGEENIPPDSLLLRVSFRLKVGTLIDSNIMQLLPIDFAKELANELLIPATKEASRHIAKEQQLKVQSAAVKQTTVEHQRDATVSNQSKVQVAEPVNVQPVNFASFESNHAQESESNNLSMLLDIPLQVTVELGRTKRSVKEILELSSGSIIELDKLAGEPVDILVNNRLIAKGEVVVIDENFGVRVTDILSQTDRLKKIR